MPFIKHPDIESPPDNEVIWRYMDLPKFLMMLEKKALYFSLLSELREAEDKWEGVIGVGLTAPIQTAFPGASGDVIRTFQGFLKNLVVNCWYCGEKESVAMWKLYTTSQYGVAIRTTVGELKKALRSCNAEVYLGRVEYRDHADPPSRTLVARTITPFRAALQKRMCYQHEAEVRAMTFIYPQLPSDVPGTIVRAPYPKQGTSLIVDLEALVHSVTTGPNFPGWAWELLRSALSRTGVNPLIVESEVFKAPEGFHVEP